MLVNTQCIIFQFTSRCACSRPPRCSRLTPPPPPSRRRKRRRSAAASSDVIGDVTPDQMISISGLGPFAAPGPGPGAEMASPGAGEAGRPVAVSSAPRTVLPATASGGKLVGIAKARQREPECAAQPTVLTSIAGRLSLPGFGGPVWTGAAPGRDLTGAAWGVPGSPAPQPAPLPPMWLGPTPQPYAATQLYTSYQVQLHSDPATGHLMLVPRSVEPAPRPTVLWSPYQCVSPLQSPQLTVLPSQPPQLYIQATSEQTLLTSTGAQVIKKEEPTSRLKPIQPAPSHVAPSPAGGHHPPPPPVNVQYIIPAPLQSVYYTHAAEPPASFILQPAPAAQPQHLAPGVHHAAVPGAPGVHSAVPAPPPGVQHPMQSVGQLPLVSAVPVLAPEPLPAASSQAAPSAELGGTVREVSTRSQATSPVYHDQVSVPPVPDPPVSAAGRTGLPSQLSYQASSPVSNRLTQDHSSASVTEHHSDVSLQTNGVDLSHHNGVLSHTSHGRSSPECPSPERASREEQVTPVQAARDDETPQQTAVETEETREETEETHLETKETPRQTVAAEEPYSIRARVKKPFSALCEVAEQHLSRVVEPRVFFVPPRWEMWKRPAVDPAGRRDYRSVESAEIARDWLRRRAAGNGAAVDQMQVRFTIEPFWEDSPRIQELHSKLADIQRLYRAQLKLHRLSPRKNSSESPAKRRPSVRGARRSAVRRRSDSTRTPPRASPPPVAAVSSRQSEGAVSDTESEEGGLDVWEDTACADTISYSFSSRRENNYSNGIRALAECKKRHVPQTSDFHLGSDPARKKRKLCPPKKHSFSPDDTETIVAKKKCYPLLKPKLKPKLKAEVIMKDSFSDGSRDPALSAADLSETTQLLVLIDGLFYRSRLEPIQPPDLYGVTVEGERCHRPNIYTQEQLLNQAVREVRPASFSSLTPGTRVLANWSPKLRGLFPGTVTEGVSPEPGMLYVEFDDGDSGYMRLEGIRMLPANYPTVEHDQDPLDTLSRRRRRASSGTSVTSSQRAASRQSVGEDRWEPHPPTTPASAPAPAANGRQAEEAKDESNVEKEGRSLSVDESTNGMDGGEARRESEGVKGKKGEVKKRKKVDGSLKKKGDGSLLSDSKKHLEGGKSKKSAHTKDRKTEPSKKKKSEQSKKSSKHEENGHHHLQNGHKKHHSHKNGDEAPKKKKKKRDSADGSPPLTAEERAERKKKKAAKRRESAASDGYVVEQESDLKLRIKSPSPSRKQEKEEPRDRHHSAEGKKKKKGESNRQRHPSGMAAFLPERQLWDWDGKGVKRSASKGKAKREVYKAIVRGAERIAVGDCAVFLSAGLPDRPYVGRIQALWETTSGQMLVQVAWFYHPEETCGLDRPLAEPKGGLFESPHMDDNDVQTISHRCQVLSLAEYRQTVSSGDNETFYRAGFYDPRCQTIRREPGV
ncbi:Protein winged eye [Amphibalanus amphitrite]|uniref:Protein winged eye n=1 Tax=Amphibalanus amphitrite TaxID=1232801 RepID=A0A6A4V8U8_AMPAM|nr:Protein winged eye [Amphibalanus amphitrite]